MKPLMLMISKSFEVCIITHLCQGMPLTKQRQSINSLLFLEECKSLCPGLESHLSHKLLKRTGANHYLSAFALSQQQQFTSLAHVFLVPEVTCQRVLAWKRKSGGETLTHQTPAHYLCCVSLYNFKSREWEEEQQWRSVGRVGSCCLGQLLQHERGGI